MKNKLTIEELKTKGTIIPFIHQGMNCKTKLTGINSKFSLSASYKDMMSFGYKIYENILFILVETIDYKDYLYFEIPISEFIKYKLVEDEPIQCGVNLQPVYTKEDLYMLMEDYFIQIRNTIQNVRLADKSDFCHQIVDEFCNIK